MLNVVCVNAGNYRQCGAEYVNNLHRACKEHISAPFLFWCFTDDGAGLSEEIRCRGISSDGWYSKLGLFRPGLFGPGERILFFDLDIIIVGCLDDLANYLGAFAGLSDFFYPHRFASGVMAWEAGECDHIWEKWNRLGCPRNTRGDQGVIEVFAPNAVHLQDVYPGQLVSFKAHCSGGVPENAVVVNFHGEPKPDNCPDKSLSETWKGKEYV